MIRAFEPRLDILPPSQKKLWPALHFVQECGFVLYGGTAVALRCGHRISVDFDFFSERPLNKEKIFSDFIFSREAVVLQEQPQTLTLLISFPGSDENDVKVSFFGKIGFGRVNDPEATNDGVLQVASMDDLMATKLKVILQRIESKDYRDIAALIEAGVSLSRGLAAARVMYVKQFQPIEALKALTYFEDGDLEILTQTEKETLIKAAGSVRDLPDVKVLSKCLAIGLAAR